MRYDDTVTRLRAQHGAKFSTSTLAPQFVQYFNSHERVRVRFARGEELTGTIGCTTGWGPCFLLMRTARSIGSVYTLGTEDRVIAVKHGRGYRAV